MSAVPLAAVGVDLGGTLTKVALVDRGGRVLGRATLPTDAARGPEAVLDEIAKSVAALIADGALSTADLCGIGIGTPGPLNLREGRIIKAANLPGWRDVPLRDLMRERLPCAVIVDNDGNAAAYGESWIGAGRGVGDLVMLTLGTGVGAGVVIEGRVLHGHFDNAAELGHTIVVVDGLPCPCGQRGCLEQYSSASGVARRALDAIRSGEKSSLEQFNCAAGASIDAERVVERARQGDAMCLRLWDEACLYLAVACINIQHAFNPAMVVLGGGMSRAGGFLLAPIRRHIRSRQWSLHNDWPEVVLTALGDDAGVIGAAGLAWQGHDAVHPPIE